MLKDPAQLPVKKPIKNLKIIGILNERCYAVEGNILRIYFRLSSPPPKGWSYRFSTVWQAVRYPGKRPAGIEEDALWIECAPEDVQQYHMGHLERAVAQANADFRSSHYQRAIAEQEEKALTSQSQALLDELSCTLKPAPHPSRQGGWGFLRRLLGSRTKGD